MDATSRAILLFGRGNLTWNFQEPDPVIYFTVSKISSIWWFHWRIITAITRSLMKNWDNRYHWCCLSQSRKLSRFLLFIWQIVTSLKKSLLWNFTYVKSKNIFTSQFMPPKRHSEIGWLNPTSVRLEGIDLKIFTNGDPSLTSLEFCKILYVTKHFLNDFRWFMLTFPCINFVRCCDIFQVSLKNFTKLGRIL